MLRKARLHQAPPNFTAEVYVLSKDEGGRHTPFFNNFRPQFYFRTTDVTGSINLPKDKGNGDAPSDNVSTTVRSRSPIACMEEVCASPIREGGRPRGCWRGCKPRSLRNS